MKDRTEQRILLNQLDRLTALACGQCDLKGVPIAGRCKLLQRNKAIPGYDMSICLNVKRAYSTHNQASIIAHCFSVASSDIKLANELQSKSVNQS